MFLIVPLGLFHMAFRPNSLTRASSVNRKKLLHLEPVYENDNTRNLETFLEQQ